MSFLYVEEIKRLIKTEADQHAKDDIVTSEFIDGTFEQIKKKVRILEDQIWNSPAVDDETLKSFFETGKKEYLSLYPIKMDPSSSLTKNGLESWLTPKREKKIEWNYLCRYIRYLERQGRSEQVIRETKWSSREIIGKLGDPAGSAAFFNKGLAVGEVQSGKTANFNAVINRSIDSGYQLIIVLSGIMEDLRSQTQDRVETEVVGWGAIPDTDQNGKKGVGNIVHFGMTGDESIQQIESITSLDTDFSAGLLKGRAALGSPKILICKKNIHVLKNIINWLGDLLDDENDHLQIPLLILDDEADNASLNNEGAKGREYASKINGHIRAILAMFQKKSYLGYTASPFANVLQDRNDPAEDMWPVESINGERKFEQVDNLFPDDFIVLLESPTNYVGAKQIFETIADTPKLPAVVAVNDHVPSFPTRLLKIDDTPVEDFPSKEDWNDNVGPYGSYHGFTSHAEYRRNTRASKRNDDFPRSLPKSLRDSVLCFILSIAVRESRKPSQSNSRLYEPHNTMLVHISRFTNWQNRTAELVEEYVDQVRTRAQNDKPDEDGSIYLEFEDVWNRHFADVISNIRDYLREGYDDGFMVPIAFEVARRFIPAAADEIDVLAINSTSGKKLEYGEKHPRKIIAVGGNRLSRGFTIRGLTINYFVRVTNYSDTLLQMGRWFGYRPGYLDCCRIFTTRDSIEKFNSTTRCIEELETEFKKMSDRGKSPNNFLLKVRKHPGVLKITRPSIMKNTTTVKWSYQDQLEMTTKFDISKSKIETVWDSFRNNVSCLFTSPEQTDPLFFKAELNGDDFLDLLSAPNNFDETTLKSMISFIKLCQEQGKLTDWTVAVKRTGQSKRLLQPQISGLPTETKMVVRKGPRENKNAEHHSLFLNKRIFRASGQSANIVSSPRDLAITLSEHEITAAERDFREERLKGLIALGLSPEDAERKLPKTIPERVYRERIPEFRGVLIIYLFDTYHCFNQDSDVDLKLSEIIRTEGYDLDIPLVGYAMGFPPIEEDPGGIYIHGDYDLKSDEADEDEITADDTSIPNDEGILRL